MRTLWIGLRTEDVQIGHELGRETIERMRNGRFVQMGTTALQAIKADGTIIGYGLVVARYVEGAVVHLNSEQCAPLMERVKRAFNLRGVGGTLTINVQETDPPALPARIHL